MIDDFTTKDRHFYIMNQMCWIVAIGFACLCQSILQTDARNIPGNAVQLKISSPIFHKSCAAPPPCTCDTNIIDCSKKGLPAVPPYTEDKLYKHLNLAGNTIYELQASAFQNLPSLLELQIQNNRIRTISPNAFDGISKLIVLNLGPNQLQSLEATVFFPLTSMTSLNLGGNEIRILPNGLFEKNQALQVLSINNNKLTNFGADLLRPLTGLTEIHIQNNLGITDFPLEVLPTMPLLTRIVLTNNKQFYCETVAALGDLVKGKDMPGHCVNHPPTFDPSISTTAAPTTAWRACPAPKPCTCNNFMDTVNCQKKNLQIVPIFRSDDNVNDIDISQNNFYRIENNAFANFPNLLRINLGSNGIVQIAPNAFSGLPNLLKLDLSANPLQTLNSQILLGLPALQTFNFHNVQMRELPLGLFSNNQQLENVFLQNGQLKSLPAELLSPLQSLIYLAVNSNPDITDFPLEVLPKLPKFSHINLGNNKQFSCETLRVLQKKLQKVDGPGHCVNHPSPSPSPTTAGSTTPHAVVTFPPPPTISDKCKSSQIGQAPCQVSHIDQSSCEAAGCCFVDYGFITFCFVRFVPIIQPS